MTLQSQQLDIMLAAGVNTKFDAKLMPMGNNAVVQNGRFLKEGAIQKIESGAAVGPNYSGTALRMERPDGVFVHNGIAYIESLFEDSNAGTATQSKRALGIYDPDDDRVEFEGYDETTVRAPWAPACYSRVARFSQAESDLTKVNVVSVNGHTARMWYMTTDFARAFIEIVEDATGRLVYSNSRLYSATTDFKPIVFLETGDEALGWIYNTGSSLQWAIYNTVTGAVTTAGPAILPASSLWDVAARAGTDRVDIYYHESGGGQIYHAACSAGGTITEAAALLHAETPKRVFSVTRCRTPALQRHVLTWQSNSSSRPRYSVLTANSTTAVSVLYGPRDAGTTTTNIERITGVIEGVSISWVQVFVEYATAAGVPNTIVAHRHAAGTGASDRPPRQLYHASIAGKALDDNGGVYLWIASTQSLQRTYYLMTAGAHFVTAGLTLEWTVVAKALGGRAGQIAATNVISELADHGSGLFGIGGRRQVRLVSDGDILEQSVEVQVKLFGRAKQSLPISGALVRTGAFPGLFTSCYRPLGPFEVPETFTLTEDVAGSIAAGTYNYKLVVEYQTEDGRLWRSMPSPATAITVVGPNATVDIAFYPPAPLLERQLWEVRVYAYRTQAGGSIYYKTDANVQWRNTGGTLALTDSLSDASLADNEVLYTTGGVLENVSPPPTESMVIANGRAWLVPSDNPFEVWASKPLADNVGIEFSDELVKPLNLERPVTAVAHMDGRLLLFTDAGVYVMVASAPDATGNGSFGETEQIAKGSGCVDPNAIVRATDAVYFQSTAGIRAVDRSLQESYIGAAVEDFNDETVLKVIDRSDTDEIWFLTDGYRFLIYNTYFKRWSYTSVFGTLASTPSDVEFFDDLFIAPSPTDTIGYLFIQRASTYAWEFRIETPWLSFGQFEALKRVRLATFLGEYRAPHTLTIDVYVDWDTGTVAQTITKILDGSAYTAGDVLELRGHLARQKCRAIKFAIYDASRSGTEESFKPSILSLEFGMKNAGVKLPASLTV